MDEGCIKTDCFACRIAGGRFICDALDKLYCKHEEYCAFYIPKTVYNEKEKNSLKQRIWKSDKFSDKEKEYLIKLIDHGRATIWSI